MNTWTPADVRAWVARHSGNVSALARRLRVGRTRLQDWMSDAASGRELPPYIQAHMETLDELHAVYGRISWQMVDALRSAADELHWNDEVAAQVESAAALLESLLPPRVPYVWNEDTNQWDRCDADE